MKRRSLLQVLAISAGSLLVHLPLAIATEDKRLVRMATIESDSDGTRLVFQVDADMTTNGFMLDRPDRAVLDFIGAPLVINPGLSNFSNALVKKIRYGDQGAKSSRLVLDLVQPAKLETSYTTNTEGGREWIVRLKPTSGAPAAVATTAPSPATASTHDSPIMEQPQPALPREAAPANTNKRVSLTVKELRQEGETIHILFAANGPIHHKGYVLQGPERGVIDFFDISSSNLDKIRSFRNEFVKGVRIGRPFANGTRVVFDCQTSVNLNLSISKPRDGQGEELLLRLAQNSGTLAKVEDKQPVAVASEPKAELPRETPPQHVETAPPSPPPPPELEETEAVSPNTSAVSAFDSSLNKHLADRGGESPSQMTTNPLAPAEQGDTLKNRPLPPADPSPAGSQERGAAILPGQQGDLAQRKNPWPTIAREETEIHRRNGNTIIMIDPGHGGIDPGAIGRGGTREKDVTLAVAKRLFHKLNGHQGCQVILTRNEDRFLTLRNRIALARNVRADLFLSLHADAYRDSRIHGASVFCLADGAQIIVDEKDQQLAHRENSSSDLQTVASSGDNQDSLLEFLQMESIKRVSIAESLQFGHKLIQSLSSQPGITIHYPRVKRVNFLVLKNPGIPSSLVEMAFLSNHVDERRMVNNDYQERVAQGLATGICKFFQMSPTSKT
ncbi:MAG: N-acetylmuramoyl-L-alanine amidase [Magnetococcales bacterium]|nr:N-acetylmuramoyl-L-alanine amidase [Magnetococcales bacterium]